MGALERAGAWLFVERLRLEWRPGTPVAGHSGRLTFRPVRNPGELIARAGYVTFERQIDMTWR
jgi:hypothetical protein